MSMNVTKEFTVYSFEELCENAKEKVRMWYLDGQNSDWFTVDCEMQLEEMFPNSSLKVQYSLGHCQGDGLNIYGKIDLMDILPHIAERFSPKEYKFLEWAFSNNNYPVELEENRRYCYCICSRNNLVEDIISELEYNQMRKIRVNTLEKFNRFAGQFLDALCGEMEDAGYQYFYEVEESELEEYCKANELVFTDNGEIFAW